MKRKLLKQMGREWSGNLWLVLELTIVATVLWVLFGTLAPVWRKGMQPRGFEVADVYTANFWVQPENSPTYVPYDSLTHTKQSEIDRLLTQLRANPYVEAVGLGDNGMPYSSAYYGAWLIDVDRCDFDSGRVVRTPVNLRYISPDAAKVLQLKGLNGETPEQVAEAIERGEIVLGPLDLMEQTTDTNIVHPEALRGVEVYQGRDTAIRRRVSNLMVQGVVRDDYEVKQSGDAFVKLEEAPRELLVRVKPGTGREFLESLTAAETTSGNLYLGGWSSLERQREIQHSVQAAMRRDQVLFSVFLLAVVFMGFLGTFWFRTQQRVGEIAVRKVCGATDRQIFRRMLAEAMLLLGVAAVPAVVCCTLIYKKLITGQRSAQELYSLFCGYQSWALWSAAVITLTLMVLVIVAAIWFPARNAMKVDPASALKNL